MKQLLIVTLVVTPLIAFGEKDEALRFGADGQFVLKFGFEEGSILPLAGTTLPRW
tara:strand:- start:334 stop:498 length:165 start_codon:yes stop_codon:yes gene_type:complete